MRELGSISGFGRSLGEGKGYPLQYSGLENSMDCTVYGVTKSRTRLSDFHFQFLQSFFFKYLIDDLEQILVLGMTASTCNSVAWISFLPVYKSHLILFF